MFSFGTSPERMNYQIPILVCLLPVAYCAFVSINDHLRKSALAPYAVESSFDDATPTSVAQFVARFPSYRPPTSQRANPFSGVRVCDLLPESKVRMLGGCPSDYRRMNRTKASGGSCTYLCLCDGGTVTLNVYRQRGDFSEEDIPAHVLANGGSEKIELLYANHAHYLPSAGEVQAYHANYAISLGSRQLKRQARERLLSIADDVLARLEQIE